MKNNIIIGSGLEALKYSLKTGFPVYFEEALKRPEPYELLLLNNLPIESHYQDYLLEFKSPNNKKKGVQSMRVWEHFMFLLCQCGLVPTAPFNNSHIEIEEDELEIFVGGNLMEVVEFDNIFIFEPYQLRSCPGISKQWIDHYKVLDHFEIRKNFDFDFASFDKELVSEIYFYNKKHGPGNYRDILCISEIDESELDNPNFSQKFAEFYLEDELLEFCPDSDSLDLRKNGRDRRAVYDYEIEDPPDNFYFMEGEINLQFDDLDKLFKKWLLFYLKNDMLYADGIL